MSSAYTDKVRRLHIVLGDQLNPDSALFDDFDDEHDAVLMMEVAEEATYIRQHQQRLVLFFAAMRHFRDAERERGRRVHYTELEDRNNRGNFAAEIERWCNKARPEALVVVRPGDYRVLQSLESAARKAGVDLEVLDDRHFLTTPDDFREFADGRKSLLMETFYRGVRRRLDVLMDDGQPRGGRWNFDKDNRESFGADGPGGIKAPIRCRPDDVTASVIDMVGRRFADAPGSASDFAYPVTPEEAERALRDFVEHRLEKFGPYQDAMVNGEPFLYHSRLSSCFNLHLLDPRRAVSAAVDALEDGAAPISSVEGFVRQIIGWREYVRGVYWLEMPEYADLNALDAELDVPDVLWTGDTDMVCVAQAVGQLLDHAYAHHIQRLMVLGLFALQLGVKPRALHEWHMAMYIDAVDWVSLPNVVGMSQYGDGGVVGTKPYCATGNYIKRMSNHCSGCRYDPGKATGEHACPFTTLYWDFLSRNRTRLRNNSRMGLQLKNLDRKTRSERDAIRGAADELKARHA